MIVWTPTPEEWAEYKARAGAHLVGIVTPPKDTPPKPLALNAALARGADRKQHNE